jgi:ferric-dicitrate binding protein FerR (iron transport regulator)
LRKTTHARSRFIRSPFGVPSDEVAASVEEAAVIDRKELAMTKRRWFEIGGIAAGVILILFGLGALALSVNGRSDVRTAIKQEQIVGTPDMTPDATRAAVEEAGLTGVTIPSCDVADEPINTGAEAKCFADYMRIHALEASGGQTYAQMGRFLDENGDPTSDPAAAAKTDSGQPVENPQRQLWVTETALATALNMGFLAENITMFGIVVGIALVLTGIGFLVLTLGGALRHREADAAAEVRATPATV